MIKPISSTKVTTTTTTTVAVDKPKKFKKAGKQGTLITMILDESGSMAKSAGMTTADIYSNGLYTSDELAKMTSRK